jgi:cell wall-associated NlpC family hydrolase
VHPRRRIVAFAVAMAVASGPVLLGAGPAHATPADDVLSRAAALEQSILENGAQIDALSEQYDAAVARRDLAQRQLAFGVDATRALAGYRQQLHTAASRAAAALYRGAGSSTPLELLRAPADVRAGRRVSYTEAAGRSLHETIERYRRVEHQLAVRAASLARFHLETEQQTRLIAAAKAHAQALELKQAQLLGGVRGELATVLRLRRAAEDPDSIGLENRLRLLGVGALPAPPSPTAAKVLTYAIEQLGKPYVFAAAGPDTFDCSGLTMMAWRQVGVSMAHFAASQYAQFPKVSIDELQPGDLVFFYPTIHHVGIYIGGGKMIHAPHTGDVVRVASVFRGSLVGAVRPG